MGSLAQLRGTPVVATRLTCPQLVMLGAGPHRSTLTIRRRSIGKPRRNHSFSCRNDTKKARIAKQGKLSPRTGEDGNRCWGRPFAMVRPDQARYRPTWQSRLPSCNHRFRSSSHFYKEFALVHLPKLHVSPDASRRHPTERAWPQYFARGAC